MDLQAWMKANGLRDGDVAERVAGLSRSQVNRIRNRKSIPSPETAKKLCDLTKLPAEAFMFVDRAA